MQLSPSGSPSYDANGNTTNDGTNTYTWNAEGRPATINSATYTMDALGRFVEYNGTGQIVYAPSGERIAFMNGQTFSRAFVPLPGQAQAIYDTTNGLYYYRHADWLGSARLGSTPQRTPNFSVAYAPFGEPYAEDPNPSDQAFIGLTPIQGLSDFEFREYSSNESRWPAPDPSGLDAADPTNPQSWNRYSYVLNNPLNAIDPNGLDCVYAPGADGNPNPDSLTIVSGDCLNNGGQNDGGVFVDNDENHPVQKSDVTLSNDSTFGIVSYTQTNGLTTGYACVGDCPSYSVQASSDTPTIGPDTSPLTPFQRSLLPPPPGPQLPFWQRLKVAVACTLGLDAELMAPAEAPPNNGNERPEESVFTQGKYKVPFRRGTPGRPPEMNKSGKSNAEAMNAAGGGAALLGNQQACLQNASGQR